MSNPTPRRYTAVIRGGRLYVKAAHDHVMTQVDVLRLSTGELLTAGKDMDLDEALAVLGRRLESWAPDLVDMPPTVFDEIVAFGLSLEDLLDAYMAGPTAFCAMRRLLVDGSSQPFHDALTGWIARKVASAPSLHGRLFIENTLGRTRLVVEPVVIGGIRADRLAVHLGPAAGVSPSIVTVDVLAGAAPADVAAALRSLAERMEALA